MKWRNLVLILCISFGAYLLFWRPFHRTKRPTSVEEETMKPGAIPSAETPQSAPQPPPSALVTSLPPPVVAAVPSPSPPPKEEHLPRGPDDLTDADFIKKYQNHGISDWLKQKPLRRFPPSEWGNIFVINTALVLALDGGGELQYRSSIANEPDDLAEPVSCVSIRSADKTLTVGEFGDGTLHIRHGPIPNSYLMSISEKHYFLSYNDRVSDQEIINHYEHPTPSSPFGILLYYVKGEDGQIRYQGHAVRWDEDPTGQLRNPDYCRSTF